MSKLTVFILVLILLLPTACNVVRGSGNVITEPREVSHFNRVSMGGSGELTITQGDEESLSIEADDNLLRHIHSEVKDGILFLGMRGSNWSDRIRPTKPIKFSLILTEIAGLDLSGSGSIRASRITAQDLAIDISGSGDVTIGSLAAQKLDVGLSGSATCAVSGGKVSRQGIDISGSGEYRGAKLESQAVEAEISGSGHATVWVRDSLSVNISGSGEVDYFGTPGKITKEVSGSGSINGRGNP
jgi:predicted small secreted protein